MSAVVLSTQLNIGRRTQGKVRDIYDLGDRILLVSTDRISAFDWILPCGIPDKGRILTQLSRHWFNYLDCPHHVLSYDPRNAGITDANDINMLAGRSVIARKAQVFPIECVVRGFLAGSGWKEYQQHRSVCGVRLPDGLVESSQLPEPIFTPATKATSGHDENISLEQAANIIGEDIADELRTSSIRIYQQAAEYASQRGILIADTKFEWGMIDGQITLVDEALTPDSSRFWDAAIYTPGQAQVPLDKQLVRDWLEQSDWDKNSPPPMLPEAIIEQTSARYLDAYRRLTGLELVSP